MIFLNGNFLNVNQPSIVHPDSSAKVGARALALIEQGAVPTLLLKT
jgi:hypothetical protein